ncbi:hypothetical protein EYF80_050540 [Liparis tanakae]|uniref:Uncharacterized protein n=1 Tax=Liparis tanakae TaxID=230148 RepID=A0A4Z2FE87_9TELE|nr:hypothetical protein EYF80_050540 [Liparis tanakae]
MKRYLRVSPPETGSAVLRDSNPAEAIVNINAGCDVAGVALGSRSRDYKHDAAVARTSADARLTTTLLTPDPNPPPCRREAVSGFDQ